MIDLSTRPELARLDDVITAVLNHTNDDTGLNVRLSGYPLVWAALIDSLEPEDEAELARQARRAHEAILRDYAARIPIQRDANGYVEEAQAWALADRIYTAVYGRYDDRRHQSQMMSEIADWIREGDWGADQVPDVEALVAEWREYTSQA